MRAGIPALFCLAIKSRTNPAAKLTQSHQAALQVTRTSDALSVQTERAAGKRGTNNGARPLGRRRGLLARSQAKGLWPKWRDGPVTSLDREFCRQIIPWPFLAVLGVG